MSSFAHGNLLTIITARKRSLGQGNIFRSVCQEFCPQEGVVSQHALQVWGVVSQHALHGGSPGPHPGSCGVWPGGSPGPHPGGGGQMPTLGGGLCIPACTELDSPLGRLLPRAVRILLECILVHFTFYSNTKVGRPVLDHGLVLYLLYQLSAIVL